MEIAHLKEFCVLAEKLNFSEAADLMYVSQPALSKHIKSLENELGAKLFLRSSKQVSLTEFGKRYLDYADRILGEYEKSEKWRQDFMKREKSTVRIGLPESQELYEVTRHFQKFGKRFPEYHIETVEMPSYSLRQSFEQGELDMFLVGMTIDTDLSRQPFEYVEAAKGCIKVLLRSDHRLAGRAYVTVEDLENERVVIPPHNTVFEQFIEDEFERIFPNKKEFLYSGYNMAITLVETGACVALLQEEALKSRALGEMKVLELKPAICYTRGLGYRPEALNEAERKYLEFAIELLKEDKL